jgi:hypothetical protein
MYSSPIARHPCCGRGLGACQSAAAANQGLVSKDLSFLSLSGLAAPLERGLKMGHDLGQSLETGGKAESQIGSRVSGHVALRRHRSVLKGS